MGCDANWGRRFDRDAISRACLVTTRVSKGYRAKRIRAKYFLPSVAGYSPAKKAKILYIENNILCG